MLDRDRSPLITIPLWILTLPLAFAGCDGAPSLPEGTHLQPVRGLVMQADGTPLSQGKIVLTPRQSSGQPLSGWVDSDGAFTLMEGQGLAIAHGDFLVHIEPPSLPPDIATGKTPKAKEIIARLNRVQQQIPAKYRKPETSNLKATIGPDTRVLPTIVLK